jgi:hypothetical protein
MFSRVLVIVLAFVVAALQVWRGAMIEASGLLGLGTGLLILRLAGRHSPLRQLAWLGFAVTAAAVVLVLMRMRG